MLTEFIYSVLFSINALIREREEILRQLTYRKSNPNNSFSSYSLVSQILVPHISHERSNLQAFVSCR